MTTNLCKLCLFKCEEIQDDEDMQELRYNKEKLVEIIDALFQQRVAVTQDEAQSICKLCRQKLTNFYEYYTFVLENQTKYYSSDIPVEYKLDKSMSENDSVPVPDVIFLVKEEISGQRAVEPVLNMPESSEANVKKPLYPNLMKRKVKTGRPKKPQTEEQLKYIAEDTLIQKYFTLKCDQCVNWKNLKNFSSYRDAHFHMQRRHRSPVVLECCGIKLLSRRNTVRHCNDHESPMNCDECGQKFAGRRVLRNHMATAHNKRIPLDDRVFICNECGKTKVEKKNIFNHLKKVHFNRDSHVCEICAVVYKTINSLQIHINVAHKNMKLPRTQCEHCGIWIQERHFPAHLKNHFEQPEPVTCEICGRKCKSKKLLQKHHRTQHAPENKRHKCSYCPKSFAERIGLREHVATHTGVSLYHCEFCQAPFKSNGNYTAHKRRLHSVEYAQQKLQNRMKREQAARNSPVEVNVTSL